MISLIKHDFHTNKPKLILMVGVALLFGIFAVAYIFYNPLTQQKSKAGAGDVMQVMMDTTQANTGEYTMTLSGTPNGDMAIRGYDFGLVFNKSKIQVKKVEYVALS